MPRNENQWSYECLKTNIAILSSEEKRRNIECCKKALSDKRDDFSLKWAVENALTVGNHLAFAIHLLHEEEYFSPSERLAIAYEELCARYSKLIEGGPYEKKYHNLRGLDFITPQKWRSYEFCYNPEAAKQQGTVLAATKSYWITGARGIQRDVVIQHALLMGLDPDETNYWLVRFGYYSLYALDVVDACAYLYLKRFAGDYTKSPNEKLKIVKDEINKALLYIKNSGGAEFINDEESKNKIIRIAYKEGAGVNIDELLETLHKDYIGDIKNDRNIQEASYTVFLTQYFTEHLDEAETIEDYLRAGDVYKSPVFTQRYYGFLRKTLSYIMNWENYVKNLVPSEWDLNVRFGNHNFISDRRLKGEYDLPKRIQSKIAKIICEYKEEQKYEACLALYDYIDSKERACLGNDPKQSIHQKKKMTTQRSIIEGREIRQSENKKQQAYTYTQHEKYILARFAIQTGNEDDLGYYLMLAGYWKRNWYTEMAFIKSESEIRKMGFYPDMSDEIILYALMYRDELLSSWVTEHNDQYLLDRDRIRKVFPFRELIMEIGYTIWFLFYYERGLIKVTGENLTEKQKNKIKESEKRADDRFKKIEKSLIISAWWKDAYKWT